MSKSKIRYHIESYFNKSFISISEIARYMGVSRDTARNLMKGIQYYKSGRAKLFHSSDIAERIFNSMHVL